MVTTCPPAAESAEQCAQAVGSAAGDVVSMYLKCPVLVVSAGA